MVVSLWSSALVIGFQPSCCNCQRRGVEPAGSRKRPEIVIKQPVLLHKQHELFDVGQITGTGARVTSLFDHRISQQHQSPRAGGGGNFCQELPMNIPSIGLLQERGDVKTPNSSSL